MNTFKHTALMTLVLGIALPLSGMAAQDNSGNSVAGKTMLAVGKVNALSAQQQRKLKRRAPVFTNDVVTTGGKAKTQIRMSDGGLLALKANSELNIAEYQYSEDTGTGSVVMELVKGGLRSVTGNIKSQNGDYQLKTSVGSIGIRGTHYEVEVTESEMLIAVWDGAVDVTIEVGQYAGSQVSFGEGEDFSYASIDVGGNVTRLIEPPKQFESGLANDAELDTADDSADGEADEDQAPGKQAEQEDAQIADNGAEESSSEETNSPEATETTQNQESKNNNAAGAKDMQIDFSPSAGSGELVADNIGFDNDTEQLDAGVGDDAEFTAELIEEDNLGSTDDFNTVDPTTTQELLSDRSGQFTYNQVESFSGTSTAGAISNFQMAMAIDFDTLGVTAGNLTFDDQEGEWRATFAGNITEVGQINLDISHASHGDNLAAGEIEAAFLDGLDSLIGSFYLEETLRPNINTNGSFIIK